MNCIKCNNELVIGKQFCPNCGALNSDQEADVVLQNNDKEKLLISSKTFFNVIRDRISYLSGIILIIISGYMIRNFIRSATRPGGWSENLGIMEWDKANKICHSYGMRLPNIEELKEAYKAGLMETWGDWGYYWSSTKNDADSYYVFIFFIGDIYTYDRSYYHGVRCRR